MQVQNPTLAISDQLMAFPGPNATTSVNRSLHGMSVFGERAHLAVTPCGLVRAGPRMTSQGHTTANVLIAIGFHETRCGLGRAKGPRIRSLWAPTGIRSKGASSRWSTAKRCSIASDATPSATRKASSCTWAWRGCARLRKTWWSANSSCESANKKWCAAEGLLRPNDSSVVGGGRLHAMTIGFAQMMKGARVILFNSVQRAETVMLIMLRYTFMIFWSVGKLGTNR